MQRPEKYATSITILHWLIAIGVILLVITGWYMVTLPRTIDLPEGEVSTRAFWFNLHKSIGLIVLALTALFFYKRSVHGAPRLPDSVPDWEIRAAILGHWLMYIFMIVVPVTGYIESNFTRWGVDFFGFHMEPWGPEDQRLYYIFNRIHVYSSNIFAVIIGLHIAAAIKHALKHDGVMSRMLPILSRKDRA
jgi:cytochrome b561